MNWSNVKVDAAWLCASAVLVWLMLATDNKVVHIVGTVVILADLTRVVYRLVQLRDEARS